MRPAFQTTVGVLALLLSACELKVKQARTPPPPQPTVAKAEPPPAPPAEPISTPQTQVRLPQPQAIDPEAVVTPPVPVEPAPVHSKRKSGRPGPQVATVVTPKPEPVETADTQQPAAEAPPRRMEPVLPESQRVQRMEEISARLKDLDQAVVRAQSRNLNDTQKHTVEQIQNLKAQAYQARDEGDIQKANGLADRAFLLLQDLTRGN